jgi:ribosome-associated toxin RatA of RatAB toxin-antitoxin module
MRAIAAAWLVAVGATAAAAPVVEEREAPRGVFQVTARFFIDAPRPIVFAVLTDYAGLPRFVSSVRRSVILEQRRGGAVVAQELAAGLLGIRRIVRVRLDITESAPAHVEFRDRDGRDFRRYSGAWQLAEAGAGTNVVYSLTAEPRGSTLAVGRVLSTTAAAFLRQLADECVRRAHTQARRIR